MLWRALKHVQNGLYIDIGAQHPIFDSVSKGFYEKGWRGVHVEPVPEYAELLRQDRPDEMVLEAALSDTTGTLDLNIIPGTGLSTGIQAYAESHRVHHGFNANVVRVPMLPLKDALASLNGKAVHWMKIDVEGLEEKVLQGWDSQVLRPWIILIEATVPMSPQLAYEGADKLLIEAGYEFAYFDGLNRFYTASERAHLAESLRTPPNVFDGAQLSASSPWCVDLTAKLNAQAQERLAQAEERLNQKSARLEQVEIDMQQLESHNADLLEQLSRSEARAASVDRHLEAVMASTSWRLTAPVRRIGTQLRRLRILSGIKR